MNRKLDSWISSFVEYTKVGSSPEIFRKWAGICTIAGALEQKVWVTTMGTPMFPHLYVIFVAPPGVGKSFITSQVWKLWKGLPEHHVASSSLTSASLADDLRYSQRNVVMPGMAPVQFHSLKICSNEMQVLIPAYDFDFMGKLTDIYDGHSYSERRRKEDNTFEIPNPQINFLAATTPKYMNSVIPEGAWDQGFMSRVIMVFSGEQERKSLFERTPSDKALETDLKTDLATIAKIYGEFVFTEEAANDIDTWYQLGGPPAPDHPRLVNYCTRRHANLIKLMMVSAIDRGGRLLIERQDFDRALEWLLEAEMHMPEVFKAMSATGDGRIVEDLHHAMWRVFLKNERVPIPHQFVFKYLMKRMPGYAIQTAIDGMVTAKMIAPVTVEGLGKCYKPVQPGVDEL